MKVSLHIESMRVNLTEDIHTQKLRDQAKLDCLRGI